MKTGLLLLLLYTLAGCGLLKDDAPQDVRLDADRPSYHAGEVVTLTLTNSSGRTFTVHPSLCDAVLQRWEASTWKPIFDDPSRVCALIGLELTPGKRVTAQTALHETIRTGRYRYMYVLHDGLDGTRAHREERIDLYTKAFNVE